MSPSDFQSELEHIHLFIETSKASEVELIEKNMTVAYDKDISERQINYNFGLDMAKIELEKVSLKYIMLGELLAKNQVFI
jgi:hypothetical protein